MRKLKLQMQVTLDGFVAGPEGELDWMSNIENDKQSQELIIQLTDTSDLIIMGRKMSSGFLEYWENVFDNDKNNPEYNIATRMVNTPKVIFSKTLRSTNGRNTRVENGDLKTEVLRLKGQPGKDIVVYGGANFVSNLIKEDLIDDYFLFVNPTAIGKGLSVFHDNKKMELIHSESYNGGIVVNHYKAVR
jgi:dihydrofolate reductase